MKIAIIGTGNVGFTLGKKWTGQAPISVQGVVRKNAAAFTSSAKGVKLENP